MHPSADKAWPSFIRLYEGTANWIYADSKGLPTTGTGNMIGDGKGGISLFGQSLPWRTHGPVQDKSPSEHVLAESQFATEFEVRAEWSKMKNLHLPGSGFAYEKHARLWLQQAEVDWLLKGKSEDNWASLTKSFPAANTWPADAQIALMGMAWWMGPHFWQSWPNLTNALLAQNFFGAAQHCVSKDKTARDYKHKDLFITAGTVMAFDLIETTYWDDKEPTIKIGSTVYEAPQFLDASELKTASPTTFTLTGYTAQLMLQQTGDYMLRCDGEFGPRSRNSYNMFCRKQKLPEKIDVTSLSRLSDVSRFYLPTIA